MTQPATNAAIRTYRIYLRDAENMAAPGHEVDLASDEEARELAMRMIEERTSHPCVEVWDRARLVFTMRRGE